MKNKKLLRLFIMLTVSVVLTLCFFFPCELSIWKCLGSDSMWKIRTMFHIFSAILCVLPFTFFIPDALFKKWLIFTAVWMSATMILIMLSPMSARDYFNLGPTKELVSFWMNVFFVVVSILMFIVMSIREWKKTHLKK